MNPGEITPKKRRSIFSVILVSCILSSMLATALTTALPPIMEAFQVTAAVGQWLTSAYSLAMGIVVLASAYLIRRFPAKKLYTAALAIFAAGLLVDVFAASFPVLMLGRLLQACGNGILMSMAQVIILTIYPEEQRGSAMGMYGLAVGAAPVIAPTLAGVVVDLFGWRTIFGAAFVISAAALIFAQAVMENVTENEIQKFDFLSLILCAAGSSGILLGLGNTGTYHLISVHVLVPLLLGAAATVLFCARQLRIPQPFLEIRIFKNREFRIAVIGSMLLYAVMISASTLMPILIQNVYGCKATVSGIVMMPGALAMAIISPFTGKIYDRMGIRKLFIVGSIALLLSSALMVPLGDDTPMYYLAAVNTVRTIAIGCLMMPLVTWGMSRLGSHLTADGTSILSALRTVAGSVGSAVFVAVMSVASGHSENLHGMRIAFLGLAALAAAELLVSIICTKKQS